MKDEKLTIYLASTYKEFGYRRNTRLKYSQYANIIDPIGCLTEEECNKIFGEHTYEWIVRRDKKLILSSDILVAYIDSYGITPGTTMEIIFSFENGIPTYLIDTKQKYINDYWLKFHTKKIFKSVDECFS